MGKTNYDPTYKLEICKQIESGIATLNYTKSEFILSTSSEPGHALINKRKWLH
jgi:hypothetical protein